MSTQPGKIWNASTDLRKKQIIRMLEEGDKSFTELRNRLRSTEKHGRARWAKRTLSIYLREMVDEEHSIKKVKKKPNGIRVVYSLEKSHHLLAERLKWDLPVDPDLQKQQLDEGGFINSWRYSLDFCFITFLNDLTVLGQWKDEMKVEGQIQSDIGDFVEILNFFGNILLERIKVGTFKPEKLQEIQRKMHAQVKRQRRVKARKKQKKAQ